MADAIVNSRRRKPTTKVDTVTTAKRKRLWREIQVEVAIQRNDIEVYTAAEYDSQHRRQMSKIHAISACDRAMGAYTALRWSQGIGWNEASHEADMIRQAVVEEVLADAQLHSK